jgi:hypothetical protein
VVARVVGLGYVARMRSTVPFCGFVLSLVAAACDSSRPADPVASSEAQVSTAVRPVEDFFSSLTGTWYGEVPGIYRACAKVSAVRQEEPWKLLTIHLDIEDSARWNVDLTLSRNQSGTVVAPVYFLGSQTEMTYPLRAGDFVGATAPNPNAFPFYRHRRNAEGVSMDGILVRRWPEDGMLQIGGFHGDTYCTAGVETSHCGTDGWMPYNLYRNDVCPLDSGE